MASDAPQQPLVLVIFGITGDLSQRKLLPALYQLAKSGDLSPATHIIGISRRAVERATVYEQLPQFVGSDEYEQASVDWLLDRTEMRQLNVGVQADYEALLQRIRAVEGELGHGASRLYYLSVPPQAMGAIVHHLGKAGHNQPLKGGDRPRLLVEKPFGYDYASAQELIKATSEHFHEDQIYRIDHYLAKETVQNMLTFRFQNPLFQSVWNGKHIDHISVTAHEKIGIEGRAVFYEQTGALRDLVQSHLLQLLAVATMDKPIELTSQAIHAQKLALLRDIRPVAAGDVLTHTVRGQYHGYREEVDNAMSNVETFVRLQLEIDNDMWRGVPIIVETGKALAEKLTEVEVCFRQADSTADTRNKLRFRIQPTEGITLQLQAKQPGIANQTQVVDMDFDYARSFTHRPAEAYERVIVDAIRGDQTLFASSDEVLASWRILENVLAAWSHSGDGLVLYDQGSTGPA
ncbi:glucose-6-phosphate dehydrogenase [Candidatus Saccharibacteria bacterium]|nr:MAG: glucose-6-phosphate dehydrogenase [Candidatus Saccharibacteria bacterium]